MENKETFSYTYSAKQQEEIKKIREKYAPKEADKMEQLRRLDESVTRKGTVISLIVGIIGALVMGFGMSCTMVWADTLFVLGIVVGIVGIALVCAAYPIYNFVVKKERAKIAPEIIRLTDELMK
ncbi:MAG: hypothetical protein ACI4JY_05590 [Oscillospiraceae bacterium]